MDKLGYWSIEGEKGMKGWGGSEGASVRICGGPPATVGGARWRGAKVWLLSAWGGEARKNQGSGDFKVVNRKKGTKKKWLWSVALSLGGGNFDVYGVVCHPSLAGLGS